MKSVIKNAVLATAVGAALHALAGRDLLCRRAGAEDGTRRKPGPGST